MSYIARIPDWAGLLLFVFVAAGIAIGVHATIRRLVPPEKLIPHHDVAGFLVAIVGVLYAVVLGFTVVTVWTAFDTDQQTSDLEAGFVGDAFGFAQLLPEPRRTDVRRHLAEYAIAVRDREFPALRERRQDPAARGMLIAAMAAVGEPTKVASINFDEALNRLTARDSVITSLRSIADNRRLRLIASTAALPTTMYLALILGGAMVLAFVYLFGVENAWLQFTMTGIVSGCIGLLFGVIVAFGAPYSGALRVSSEAWNYVITNNNFTAIAKTASAYKPTAPR